MADKIVNAKQPDKPKVIQKVKAPEKDRDRDRDKERAVRKPNAIQNWYRETMGELRKVSWPTVAETRRLTYIVLAVMVAMAVVLGSLDYVFSRLIALLVR